MKNAASEELGEEQESKTEICGKEIENCENIEAEK